MARKRHAKRAWLELRDTNLSTMADQISIVVESGSEVNRREDDNKRSKDQRDVKMEQHHINRLR